MNLPEIKRLLKQFSELQGAGEVSPELRLQANKIFKDIQEARKAFRSQLPGSTPDELFGWLEEGLHLDWLAARSYSEWLAKKGSKVMSPQYAMETRLEELLNQPIRTAEELQEARWLAKEVYKSRQERLLAGPRPLFHSTSDVIETELEGRPAAVWFSDVVDKPARQLGWTSDFKSFQSGQPSDAEIADSIYSGKRREFIGYKGDWIWDTFEQRWIKRPKSKKDVVPEFFLSSNRLWETSTRTEEYSAPLVHAGKSEELYTNAPRNVIEDISGQVIYVPGAKGGLAVQLRNEKVFTQKWYKESTETEEAEERLVREILSFPERRAAWQASLTSYGREWLISRGGADAIIGRVKARVATRIFGSGGAAREGGGLSSRPSRYLDEELGRYFEPYSPGSSFARWQNEQLWGDIGGGGLALTDRSAFINALVEEVAARKRAQGEIVDEMAISKIRHDVLSEYGDVIKPGKEIAFMERLGGKDKLKELYESGPSAFFYPYQPIGTLAGPTDLFELNRQLVTGRSPSTLGSRTGSFIGTVGESMPYKSKGERTAAQKVWVYDQTGKIRVTTFTENQPVLLVEGQTYQFQQMKIQPYVPPGSSDVQWNANANVFSKITQVAPPKSAPVPEVPSKAAIDYSKPVVVDTIEGEIRGTSPTGEVVTSPITKWKIGTQRGDMAAFLPLAGMPFLQGNMMDGNGQVESKGMGYRDAGEQAPGLLEGAYNILGELGSIWYQKASEANERIKARDEASPGAEFGNLGLALAGAKYQMAQLPWNVLDVLGAVLYPLSYPGQALWGEASGIGAMEGIRREVRPANVLGIENPLEALVTDIAGDPLTWVGTGAFTKGKRVFGGARAMLADESAVLGVPLEKTPWEKAGMSRTEYVNKKLAEVPEPSALATGEEAAAEPVLSKEWSLDALMAGYDAKRLEQLSSVPHESLTLKERSELNELIFKDMFKDVGAPIEPVPLTEEDRLALDRFNADIQKRMKVKYYDAEPKFTIDGKPVVPIPKVQQEKCGNWKRSAGRSACLRKSQPLQRLRQCSRRRRQ